MCAFSQLKVMSITEGNVRCRFCYGPTACRSPCERQKLQWWMSTVGVQFSSYLSFGSFYSVWSEAYKAALHGAKSTHILVGYSDTSVALVVVIFRTFADVHQNLNG